jgi:GTPase SAR1 family protein
LTLYYKNSDAVVIVFDVTEPSTFKTVDYWAKQIETHCDSPPGKLCYHEATILVGNKVDLRGSNKGVPAEEVKRYLAKRSKWRFLECSAKQNYNVK